MRLSPCLMEWHVRHALLNAGGAAGDLACSAAMLLKEAAPSVSSAAAGSMERGLPVKVFTSVGLLLLRETPGRAYGFPTSPTELTLRLLSTRPFEVMRTMDACTGLRDRPLSLAGFTHARTSSFAARVAVVQRSFITVLTEAGERLIPSPPDLDITVGDWLSLEPETRRVLGVVERKSLIARIAAGNEPRPQSIAANVDTLFVVMSCNDDFNLLVSSAISPSRSKAVLRLSSY